jgi:hypothetical protein
MTQAINEDTMVVALDYGQAPRLLRRQHIENLLL